MKPLQDAPFSRPPVQVKAPLRVLVVDDDPGCVTTLSLIIEHSGCEVRSARDGQTALEVFDAFQPDAVVMDINLPGIDGHEVARRLRQLRRSRPMCLIALTGYGHEQDLERSLEAGFDHHLVKPTDPQEICALLARLSAAREPPDTQA